MLLYRLLMNSANGAAFVNDDNAAGYCIIERLGYPTKLPRA